MPTTSSTLTLEALAARLEEQAEHVAAVEAENAALRAEMTTLRNAQAVALPPARRPAKRPRAERTSRRALLKLGGAAAAATVAAGVVAGERSSTALAAPQHVASAPYEGDASGPGNVGLIGAGTSGADGVHGTSDSSGVGVYGASPSLYGVWGSSTSNIGVLGTSTNGTGVHGKSDGGFGVHAISTGVGVLAEATQGGTGVWGTSDTGVAVSGQSTSGDGVIGGSTSGAGVTGGSGTGVGGVFSGGRAALSLTPVATAPGAPTSGAHFAGDVYVDSNVVLWVCTANGTPGTWVRLPNVANGTTGGALTFLSTPIRLLDTRMGASGAADTPNAKIQAGSANTFHLPVAGISFGGVTIPSNAQALVGNCTVVNPAGVGDLAAYPDLVPLPNTAVMHYLTGQIVSNGITIGLGTNGKLAITALSAATDVIIDCQGFIS